MIILSGAGTVADSALDPGSYLAGLDWELDGDDATIDGVPEFDWLDISGADRHYGQNTVARQPTLVAGPNGHQLVRFGTNKCLVPDPLARTYGAANTLICVCTPSSAADYIIKGAGGEGGPAFISDFAAAFEYFYVTGGERDDFAASASGLHILTLCKTDNTGNYVGYFDGVEVFSNAVDNDDDWNTNSATIIGAFTAGSSVYDGDIAYVIHFNQNHAGAGGLDDLHDAIKARFGIA